MSNEQLPVAILAGGLATRMRPHTNSIPKCLLEVAGEPFLAHQLRLLKKNDIEHVVMCLGHLGEQVQDYLGDGSEFKLKVSYSFDGGSLLGTAGALRKALPLLGEAFFVLYGDSYLLCDYQQMHKEFLKSFAPAMMSILRNEGKWDTSNVEYQDGKLLRYSKKDKTPAMQYVDYGLSILTPRALRRSDDSCLAEVFGALVTNGEMRAFEVKERFYEIGSPDGLRDLENYLRRNVV